MTDTRCGVDNRVCHRKAVLDAYIARSDGNRFVEGHDPALEALGHEALGHGASPLLCQVLVDLAENEGGQKHGSISLNVMSEGCRLGVFSEVFEPAGGIHYVSFRSVP